VPDRAVVVTSISAPNKVLSAIARGCQENDLSFIVVGDIPSPQDFQLDGCEFLSIEKQSSLGLKTVANCPQRHYARKNIGYLLAMRNGAQVIVETDDDNLPLKNFWSPGERRQTASAIRDGGWVNVYRYFHEGKIWPRGLPLAYVNNSPALESSMVMTDCPIQQGLVNGDPDVDAIYRMLLPLPQDFSAGPAVALGKGTWCPFNSQNTAWWKDAFPLMYLPGYCSFRVTDIWRSFVAQRIAWENGWSILFHAPTLYQERNAHDLTRDFQEEIPGYAHNDQIAKILAGLSIPPGRERIPEAMRACYAALVKEGVFDERELPALASWLEDVENILPPGF